ncbi:DUF2235 domain-containing protein, partial [Flavobacterium psychrophilum]|nr:DUF2235 domain-containing protein [Flavobacterium psychrophilum]
GGASENKKKVDFTFGVFLDGTLNNMYNTEVRKAAENKAQTNTSGLILSQADANKIYQKKGDPDDMESSYENDLSNPAILYKNYVQKTSVENQFSIYTEGVGTNSAPKKQGANMAKEDYKSDDLMSGPAFGMGSAGIMDGVKKAIIDAEKKIFEKLKPNEIIGTITFDVFGFSRGAASARHFVHVVTHAPYKPTVYQGKGHVSVLDLQNNHLHPSYQKKTMPAFGLLGQLLKEKDKLDPLTKVNVRFAGLYDTVPHHGLFQWNDIKDLGLNSINKADYVVHFIAADEHRANFSLVDISSVKKTAPDSKEKGGIERYYPGVHCDVGGAYEEGRPDNPLRIDAADFPSSLESLRQELIKQGWFKDKEIFTKFDITGMGAIMNIHRLEGKRARLSNQYSYIPLHHMAEICKLKNVPITKESVTEFKNFKENSKINGITGNVAFLTRIKSILHDYTFSGGKPLEIIEPPRNKPEPSNKEKRDIHEIAKDNTRVVKEVRLDIINDEVAFNDLNKDIRFLRNHYLHWNSTYGEKGIDIGVQKNYPRILNGKRERHVR